MTTAAEIRQQILDLQNRYNVGDIEVNEYNQTLEKLQLDLSNALQREAGVPPVPPDKTEAVQQYQLRQRLQGRGGFTVPREIDEREAKRREQELGQSLSREEQDLMTKASIRQFQIDTEPLRIGTKAYRDPYTVSKGMSRIVDPKAGLVVDRKTGQIRKAKGVDLQDLSTLQPLTETIAGSVTSNPVLQATIIKGLGALADYIDVGDQTVIPSPTAELFVEGLKPQRIATDEQVKQMEAVKESVRNQRKQDLRRFFKKQGKTDEEVEKAIKEREEELIRFTDDIRPFALGQKGKEVAEDTAKLFLTQTPYVDAGIVETPLAVGLRSLNITSAFAAPALDWVNDLIQTDEGRSVVAGTVASALPTYLQPFVSQVVSEKMKGKLAPIATRKGAGYEKTEMEGALGQGLTNMIKGQGLFSQLGAQSLPPETNYNPLDPTVQGSFASTVTTFMPEFAVPVLPLSFVVKPAQAVSRGILFAGQRKSLENAFKRMTKTMPDLDKLTSVRVTVDDFLDPHTVSYKASEMGADIVAGSKVRDSFLGKRWTFDESSALSKRIPQSRYLKTKIVPSVEGVLSGDDALLRGVNRVANETIKVIEKGGKPKVASDLIQRGIAVARFRNIPLDEVEKVVVQQNKNAVTSAWSKTRTILEQSKRRPLRAVEEKALRESLDVLNKNKVYEKIPESIRNSPEVIYDAIRSSTSQVIRDNLLRTMPVDLVHISDNVAVPKSKIYTSRGKPTREYTKYLEEHRELLDFKAKSVNNQEVYTFTPDRLAALRGYQQQRGIQFSPGVQQKLENGQPFTAIERQELFDSVGAQLALDYLSGTRLRTAGLQSDLADAGIVAGDTLIPQVRGKKSTFAIKAKGLANAIRILQGRPTQPVQFFNDSASAAFKSFERSVQTAADAAPKQVIANIKRATKAEGAEAINVQSGIYMDLGVQLERSFRKGTAIRADQPQISDISPTARKDFVGVSPYEKNFKSRLQEKIQQKRQARAEKRQERIKSLSKIKTQQEEIFDRSLAKTVESEMKDLQKLRKEEAQINNQIDEYIKEIREDQMFKSKEASKRRTLQAASERYGHKQVKDFIEDMVGLKNLEYDDLATVIDDLVKYMDVYEEGFIRYGQWESVLKNFFVGPEVLTKKVISTSEMLKFAKEQDQLLKLIVKNPERPFFAPNNLKPINPSTLKKVVEGLRSLPGGGILKQYGLKKSIFSRDENFVLPILQKMMSIQKLQNTQEAIAKFARTEPDFVLSMKRTQEGMVGLESVEAISKKVEKTIRDTLAAGDNMKIFSEDLKNVVFYQVKEILFDGMMKDVWVNTSRSVQEKFLQKYLNKMVEQETVAINMDDFLRTVIIADNNKAPLIKSRTFDRVNERLKTVLNTVQENIVLQSMKKNVDVDLMGAKLKVVKEIKESLPGMIKTMNVEYLGKLTGIGKGPLSDSLFAQQIQQVTDRMTMYGLNANAVSKALKSINPRIKMIGKENLALVYGQDIAERAKLITEMTESKYFERVFKSQAFNKYAQQAFKKDAQGTINRAEILTQIAFNTVIGTLGMLRRWTTAAMLGGQNAPNTRFFGFNRITAPFIMSATVLNAPLRLSSVARIVSRSFDLGAEVPVVSGLNKLLKILGKPNVFDLSAANKLRFAPPEEIVVFAKDGAKRDYTAGELRRIINQSGMEYSRADAEFFDSQVNAMLIELGINEQGLNRYRSQQAFLRNNPRLYKAGKKLLENTRTSQNNIFTQLSRYQDSELRRVAFVEYLRNGYSIEEAVTAGKSSMLDYSTLSDFEKKYLSNAIWFYAFQRTMITSQINAIYKGVVTGKPSLSLRMLRSQDVLSRQMAEDYNDYTNQQLGRVYNIFAGKIDDVPLTVGGPPNPQIQLLDLISTGLVANRSSELAEALFLYVGEQKPYMGPYIKYFRAKESGRIPPFPPYLQYDAEASGNLEYFIERYGLIPRRKMPGKPLTMGSEETDAGVLYDFPDGEKGLAGYKRYLYDEAAGLTAAGVLINQGLDVLAKEEGIPVNDLFVRLFGQRFKRDLTKAEMFSAKRGDRIVTPEGEKVVPFESRYLKTGTIQGGKISEVFEGDTQSAILWSLYQLGLATPLKGAPAEKNIIYQLNRVNRALDQADKESQ